MLSVKSHDISFLETTLIKSLLIHTWYTINENRHAQYHNENQYLYKHYYQKYIFHRFSVVISCSPIAILWVHSVRDFYRFGMHHHYYGSCKIARLFIVWVTYKIIILSFWNNLLFQKLYKANSITLNERHVLSFHLLYTKPQLNCRLLSGKMTYVAAAAGYAPDSNIENSIHCSDIMKDTWSELHIIIILNTTVVFSN